MHLIGFSLFAVVVIIIGGLWLVCRAIKLLYLSIDCAFNNPGRAKRIAKNLVVLFAILFIVDRALWFFAQQ